LDEFDDSKSQQYVSQKELMKEKQRAYAKQRREEFKNSDFAIKLRARQKELRKAAYENAKKRKKEREQIAAAPPPESLDIEVKTEEDSSAMPPKRNPPGLRLVYSAPREN